MTKTTYNFESLDRHGILPVDADDVLATGMWEEIEISERGNKRLMFVGFTANGRLLEAGVEYFEEEDREHVFHADDATKYYQQLFEKGIRS